MPDPRHASYPTTGPNKHMRLEHHLHCCEEKPSTAAPYSIAEPTSTKEMPQDLHMTGPQTASELYLSHPSSDHSQIQLKNRPITDCTSGLAVCVVASESSGMQVGSGGGCCVDCRGALSRDVPLCSIVGDCPMVRCGLQSFLRSFAAATSTCSGLIAVLPASGMGHAVSCSAMLSHIRYTSVRSARFRSEGVWSSSLHTT